jgi:hypothetical protein
MIFYKVGLLVGITRLRVRLASLRDSPKSRLIYIYCYRVPVKSPEAKLKGVAKPKGILPEPSYYILTTN